MSKIWASIITSFVLIRFGREDMDTSGSVGLLCGEGLVAGSVHPLHHVAFYFLLIVLYFLLRQGGEIG